MDTVVVGAMKIMVRIGITRKKSNPHTNEQIWDNSEESPVEE
jgi:hypothetical protein